MRKIEENTFNGGMSYEIMMENAGKACFEKINELVELRGKRVCVVCGNGNNGGDGLVIARYIKEINVNTGVVFAMGHPKTETALAVYGKLKEIEIFENLSCGKEFIKSSDIIIDCMFGIGFKGSLTGEVLEITELINSLNNTVISIDIPSGLHGDCCEPEGEHVKADITLAIGCMKPVHTLKPSKRLCGKVFDVDIGFPKECFENHLFEITELSYVKNNLVPRNENSNKGTFGKLLSVCGSRNMQGAAVLCANAAVKSGVGLLTCAFPQKAYGAIAPKLTEPLMLPLPDDENGFLSANAIYDISKKLSGATAVVVGCGLGVTKGTEAVVDSILKNAKCPIIIDADGLNILSENIDILKTATVPIILTPHPGEMARMLKTTIEEVERDRMSACKLLCEKTNAVVLLKGCNTVIAMGDKAFINPTGNSGMAKGGSGDALAGIIGSFSAQGMDAFKSAVCGAYIHGMAGDLASQKYSVMGMTPTMLVDCLPELFNF